MLFRWRIAGTLDVVDEIRKMDVEVGIGSGSGRFELDIGSRAWVGKV